MSQQAARRAVPYPWTGGSEPKVKAQPMASGPTGPPNDAPQVHAAAASSGGMQRPAPPWPSEGQIAVEQSLTGAPLQWPPPVELFLRARQGEQRDPSQAPAPTCDVAMPAASAGAQRKPQVKERGAPEVDRRANPRSGGSGLPQIYAAVAPLESHWNPLQWPPFGIPLTQGTPSTWIVPQRGLVAPREWDLLCRASWGAGWHSPHSELAVSVNRIWRTQFAWEVRRQVQAYSKGPSKRTTHDCLSPEWRSMIDFPYCRRKYDSSSFPEGLTRAQLGDAWLENGLFCFIESAESRWRTRFPVAGRGFTSKIHAQARDNAYLKDTAVFLGLADYGILSGEHGTGTQMELLFYELACRVWDGQSWDNLKAADLLFLTVAVHVFIVMDDCGPFQLESH